MPAVNSSSPDTSARTLWYAGGMHYTSIENIHEVINPLFLDDLKAEQADIKATSVAQTKRERDRVRKGE